MKAGIRALVVGAALAGLGLPTAASGASCTDGVDCYCDTINDPNVLVCEDFEAISLHQDVGAGDKTNSGGENIHGAWYDSTGYPGNRGFNSYWSQTYGPITGGCAWRQGDASSPKVGESCKFGTCSAGGEWRADNLWQANSNTCIDIIRNGEFDDEIPDLRDPVVPGSHSGVFDGLQVFGRRIGAGKLGGLGSHAQFGGGYRTVGVTMALAYPTNSARADLWDYPWKHNEWVTVAEGRGDGAFTFHNGSSLSENDPFQHFMFLHRQGGGQAACESAIANAVVRRGTVGCNDVAFEYRADPSYYRRSTDFPFGEWGCVRGHFKNLGSADTEIKIWFNGTLIVDIDELDGSFLSNRNGYKALMWNSYSNRNQTSDVSTETTYRYEDNVHITAGAPPTCSEIGFGGGSSGGGSSGGSTGGSSGDGSDQLTRPGRPTLVQ